ncbi:MAG: hypothetical protein AAFU67_14175, partial [Bacteroidota bacterium]
MAIFSRQIDAQINRNLGCLVVELGSNEQLLTGKFTATTYSSKKGELLRSSSQSGEQLGELSTL